MEQKMLKELQAQFDKMRGAYEVMSALAEVRKEEIESLQALLADERRRERAAVADLEYACGSSGEFELRSICDICRRKQTDGTCPTQCEMNSLAASNKWEWRGPQEITGDTSDGYHTFNELYHHRAVLFSVICNDRPTLAWKSKQHHDGTMYDGMFIVGIQTPEGQATYHYDVNPYWVMFRVPELPQAPEWDGHTPAQAIERIGKLCAQPENAPLTCDGCEHDGSYENEREYGYPSPCTKCRQIATDNYRRKPERSELDA